MASDSSSGNRSGMTLGRILRSLRRGTPVNKGPEAVAGARRLPQIDNPVLIGAVGVGAMALGAVAKYVVPRRQGRSERFAQRLADVLTPEERSAVPMGAFFVDAQVQEAFGKPALVSIDGIIAPDAARTAHEAQRRHEAAGTAQTPEELAREAQAIWDELQTHPDHAAVPVDPDGAVLPGLTPDILSTRLMGDYLERLVEAAWDNPEIAPVAIRGRVIWRSQDEDRVLVDMNDLGFPDETARPADLFDRYGPPASDPRWHP